MATDRFTRTLSSEILGPNSRYRLAHVEVTILGMASRWWHVYDAERADEWCGSLIIQQSTREDALRFLRLRHPACSQCGWDLSQSLDDSSLWSYVDPERRKLHRDGDPYDGSAIRCDHCAEWEWAEGPERAAHAREEADYR